MRMSSNVHLVFGDDEYAVSAKAEEIVRAHVSPESMALGLETVDGCADTVEGAGQAVDLCLAAVLTQGMFAASKVVWLKKTNFLTDTVIGRSDNVKPRVNRLAERIANGLFEATVLVVSANGVDKRHALYRAVKKHGRIYEFWLPEKPSDVGRSASERMRALAAEHKLRMPNDVQACFLERTGANTRHMIGEMEKLSVYLGERDQVRMDDVRAIVSYSRETPAWDLADAFGKRELARSLELTRQLLFQKESGIRLVITIEGRIRDLMLYKEGIQRKWITRERHGSTAIAWSRLPPEADKILAEELDRDPRGTHPYRAGLLVEQAQGFSREQLRECQQLAVSAHEQLVSSALPESLVLEMMLVKMLA